MSQEQKSIKDLYDLLLAMSGGGATTQDVVDAINYISYDKTYNLKTVIDEINNNLNETMAGTVGPSVLLDQSTGQTAAQTLTSIQNLLVNIDAILTNVQDSILLSQRTNNQFNYRSNFNGASLPAAGAPALLQFNATAIPFIYNDNNFVKATIQNRTNRDIVLYDGATNPLLQINAGLEGDVTGILTIAGGAPNTYPAIWVARASGGAATGFVYLSLYWSTQATI